MNTMNNRLRAEPPVVEVDKKESAERRRIQQGDLVFPVSQNEGRE